MSKHNSNKQIKIGAIISYISIVFNIVTGLIYTPWMIKKIGDGDYGLYTLANSLITLFLVDFGLGSAVTRYISKYKAENNQEKIDNFLGAIYKLYLIIDAIILVALVVVYFFIGEIYVGLTPDEISKFKIVYIISAGFAIINFPFVTLNGILNAYEEFIWVKLADMIYRLLFVASTVTALLLGQGLFALVAIHALIGLIMILLKFIVIKKKLPINVNWRYSERSLYKDIFSFSLWVTILLLAQRLIFTITPSILGIVATTTAIALFGIVSTIEGYTFIFTTAIGGMFMPTIARIYEGENSEKKIGELMLKVGKFQFALNGLIIVGFAVVGKVFIELWVGPSYLDAYYGVLLIIVPGIFCSALQIASTAMTVKKKVNIQAYITLGSGIINVILSFILSSYFGALGACASICVAYLFRDVAVLIAYRKVLRLDILGFMKSCYLRMGIPLLITLALGLVINYFIGLTGWAQLIVVGIIVVVIYFLSVFFMGLNKLERDAVLSKIFKTRKNKVEKHIDKIEEK